MKSALDSHRTMADLAALVTQCEAAGEAVKTAKGGGDKAAIADAVAKLVAIKEQITKIDPAHPMAIVDKKAAKKKAAAEKKAAAAAAGAKPAAEGGDKPMSKNAQKALAKKQAKLAKKAQHKENAAANAPPPPPTTKDAAPKEGDLAAALSAIASDTAGPLASKAAHWRSLAPQACGSTPMEKAKCAEWMAWAEAPPADAAQVLDAALADRSFLAAERLTLADVACYVACKQAVAGASLRNAARWLRQAQAECRRLAPKAAWPELVSVGPQNIAGPLAASNTAAPKAKPPPKAVQEKPKAPVEAKKKEKKPKAPKPAKAPPAPSMPEPSSAVWKSTSASVHIHFSAMVRPSWLGRAVRNEHHHAIEQASRRWRGGRM